MVLTVAREISVDPALANMPMVQLTSLGEENRRDVQAAGFHHVLTKPVRQSRAMLSTLLGVPLGGAVRVPSPAAVELAEPHASEPRVASTRQTNQCLQLTEESSQLGLVSLRQILRLQLQEPTPKLLDHDRR